MTTRLIMRIILKRTEILNHYTVYQELHCIPGTNSVIGQLYYKNKQTNKNSQKKRSGWWLPEVGIKARGHWMRAVKRHKLPVIR